MLQKDFAGYIGIGCKTVTRYLRNHRLDGTILVEGGVNDNIKEMQGREPLWLTS
jgi:predicted transcriptional regulator